MFKRAYGVALSLPVTQKVQMRPQLNIMKHLLYLYFINDRYANIEGKVNPKYDYYMPFLDSFGTSKTLRASAFVPKDEEERRKVDEAYEFSLKHHEEWVNTPETFWTRLDDHWHAIIQTYYEGLWLLKGLLQRIFR